MKNHILTVALACVTILAGGAERLLDETASRSNADAISIVLATNRSTPVIIKAIDHLKAFHVPEEFWRKIANNPSYPPSHRKLCVLELFRRYAAPEMSLLELRNFLTNCTWLSNQDIKELGAVTGLVPLHYNLDDSVFRISVLPETNATQAVIYVRILGRIDLKTFAMHVLGSESIQGVERLHVAKIATWASTGE